MRETEEIHLEALKVLSFTQTFKNVFFSGFLPRHQFSINFRGRQAFVMGWSQSQDVTPACLEVGWPQLVPSPEQVHRLHSKTSDGKANLSSLV